ncbi:MAG: hypothetical protein GXP49_13425 [Deltaproteobacteria bacterium]|nr:hypothetical protein [Deltaproteobacteria bacterium]
MTPSDLDRRGFFKLFGGKGNTVQPGKESVHGTRLGFGGWVEARADNLAKSGMGDLLTFFERTDLGIIMFEAVSQAKAASILAQTGIGAVVSSERLPRGILDELEGYRIEHVVPGEMIEKTFGGRKLLFFAAEPLDHAWQSECVDRAKAVKAISVAIFPRMAWPVVPGARERDVAGYVAELGAGLVIAGPAAPFAGMVKMGESLAIFGLGQLIMPMEMPGNDSVVLLEVVMGNKGVVSWKLAHAAKGMKGRPPFLLNGKAAVAAESRSVEISRKVFRNDSAL